MEEVRWALGGEESDLKNDRHSPYEVRAPAKIWRRAWLRHPDLRRIFLGSVLRGSISVMDQPLARRAPTLACVTIVPEQNLRESKEKRVRLFMLE